MPNKEAPIQYISLDEIMGKVGDDIKHGPQQQKKCEYKSGGAECIILQVLQVSGVADKGCHGTGVQTLLFSGKDQYLCEHFLIDKSVRNDASLNVETQDFIIWKSVLLHLTLYSGNSSHRT